MDHHLPVLNLDPFIHLTNLVIFTNPNSFFKKKKEKLTMEKEDKNNVMINHCRASRVRNRTSQSPSRFDF
jgi:hypothetical protein